MNRNLKFGILSAMSLALMAPADSDASGAAAAPTVPAIPAVPAVPATPPAAETAAQKKSREKQEKDAAKAKDKADKEAAKLAAAEEKAKAAATPAVKPPSDTKNGVTRPSSGKTKLVWDTADAMSAAKKAPVERKDLTDVLLAAPHLLVVGTIHTQYGKWRKYHGLVTVKAVPATPAVPAIPPAA